ncbi:MAG: cytochrome P450 [Chloroflexi bacterium]|nr:cytochrome P450 [Chloroflexota bacterium]
MRQLADESEDLLSPEAVADPHAYFGQLRSRDAIHWNPLWNGWIVTRHKDVTSILLDHERFSSDRMGYLDSHASDEKKESLKALYSIISLGLPFIDPPDHTRLRLLHQRASFTPGQLASWRPRVQAIVDDLLDSLEPEQPVDFIEALSFPLPMLVTGEIIGFPAEDRDQVRHWTQEVALSTFVARMDAGEKRARAEAAAKDFMEYTLSLIRARRAEPRDDLLTAFVNAEHEGDLLSEEEIVSNIILLMIAGHETTSNLLANGLLAFIRNPAQIDLVRRDGLMIGAAVEECLRFDPPVKATTRWAKIDVEMDGRTMKAEQKILLALASANRDPEQFPDPDRFDITRRLTPQQHTSFVVGIHYCLGAPLARIEAEVTYTSLFERFSSIELASEDLEYKPSAISRSLTALPVVMS